MGKASKLKLIRRMAAKMPTLNVSVPVVEKLTGQQLIDRAYKEQVEPGEMYKHVTSTPVKANHERRMKALYNKHGAAGIQAYAFAVKKEEDKIK